MNSMVKVAVLGSTGYTGLELINILIKHPNVLINFLGSETSYGKSITSFDAKINYKELPLLQKIKNINFFDHDVIFLCLPHNISQSIIKNHIGKSKFIDLSADFRLNNAKVYNDNYNNIHKCPELLNEFVYGLPEINKEIIKKSKNIAVPGCYPTSVLLPLIPLLKNKLIKSKNIIIDSKSGYSGAGKNFDISKINKNNVMNFYNYGTNNHRHICEIQQELSNITEEDIKFSFNPHILPIFRGMMSTIYCDLNKDVSKEDLKNCLIDKYKNENFIKILNSDQKAEFYTVIHTNNCLIKFFNNYDENKIIIVSLIDNLIKGASGQAVQSMNLMFGINENLGLQNKKSA